MIRLIFASVVSLFLLLSCSSGINPMVEEYNSRFNPFQEKILTPMDDNYNPNDMLCDLYHVADSDTLCIPAPDATNATYKWKLTDKDGKVPMVGGAPLNFTAYESNRSLIMYIPDLRLPAATYKLTLTLTINKEGGEPKVLTDSGYVAVYENIQP